MMKITKTKLRKLIREVVDSRMDESWIGDPDLVSQGPASEKLHQMAVAAGREIAQQQDYVSRDMYDDPSNNLIDQFVEEAEWIRSENPELVAQAEAEGYNVFNLEAVIEYEGFGG